MVMREHRFGFFQGGIGVCYQQGRPFLASLDLSVERIEAVYHGFELRGESEVIHRRGKDKHVGSHEVRTQFLEIVIEYALTVHTTTVAGDVGRDLASGAVEAVHLVSRCVWAKFEQCREVCQYAAYLHCRIIKSFVLCGADIYILN